jgi:hypothetical protein
MTERFSKVFYLDAKGSERILGASLVTLIPREDPHASQLLPALCAFHQPNNFYGSAGFNANSCTARLGEITAKDKADNTSGQTAREFPATATTRAAR